MDTIVVKIESTYISLALIKDEKKERRIVSTRRTSLPDDLSGDTDEIQPEYLTALVINAIKKSEMHAANIDLYFGAAFELFSEYRFSKTAAVSVKRKRENQEEQILLADTGPVSYRKIHYTYEGEEGGLSASAVFAAKTDLCEKLVSGLEREGYNVRILSSSLIAFAETAKTLSETAPRVLVIEAEKKEYKLALFTEGKLARLSRFSGGTDIPSSAEMFLPYITDEIKVVFCGFKSQEVQLRELVKNAGAAAADSVDLTMADLDSEISLSGELAYQDKFFPRIFSAITMNEGNTKKMSYLPEKQREQKTNVPLITICIASFLVALFICAIPPLTLMSAEREHSENKARFEDHLFAAAREKLKIYRLFVSEYTEILEAENAVPKRDLSYAAVIDEVRGGLLSAAEIDEMFYEKNNGLFIDCKISEGDLESFDLAKSVINKKGEMTVYEPTERTDLGEGIWRIQIRVTQTPVPGEAP